MCIKISDILSEWIRIYIEVPSSYYSLPRTDTSNTVGNIKEKAVEDEALLFHRYLPLPSMLDLSEVLEVDALLCLGRILTVWNFLDWEKLLYKA